MGVCYWEWKRRRDSAYLTVRWTILGTDAKLLLKGCWMWVCVSPSSSLPVLSMCVCVCAYNDARQRGGESTAQHKWWLHSLTLLSFCHTSSCPPAIYIFSVCLTLFFIFVLFCLLSGLSTPSLSTFCPSSSSPPSVFVFVSLCCHTLSHQSQWSSIRMLHSQPTHVHTCCWTVML